MAPPYDFNNEKGVFKIFFKVYCPLIIIIHACAFGYSVSKLMYESWPTTSDILTEVLMESSAMTFYFLLICVSLINSYLKRNTWSLLLSSLGDIDRELSPFRIISSSKGYFVIETITCPILIIFHTVFELYEWSTIVSWNLVKLYIYSRVMYCATSMIVIMICNLSVVITLRFKTINTFFKTQLSSKFNSDEIKFNIQKTAKIYLKLCFVIEMYNSIFGWQIFLLLLIQLASILDSFNVFLYSVISTENIYVGSNIAVKLPLIYAALVLVMGVFISNCCCSCNKEAKKTSELCYQLLQVLSDEDKEGFFMLEVLAKLSSQRCPQIKAANAFSYNRNVLFTILNSAIFYIIISIQLNV